MEIFGKKKPAPQQDDQPIEVIATANFEEHHSVIFELLVEYIQMSMRHSILFEAAGVASTVEGEHEPTLLKAADALNDRAGTMKFLIYKELLEQIDADLDNLPFKSQERKASAKEALAIRLQILQLVIENPENLRRDNHASDLADTLKKLQKIINQLLPHENHNLIASLIYDPIDQDTQKKDPDNTRRLINEELEEYRKEANRKVVQDRIDEIKPAEPEPAKQGAPAQLAQAPRVLDLGNNKNHTTRNKLLKLGGWALLAAFLGAAGVAAGTVAGPALAVTALVLAYTAAGSFVIGGIARLFSALLSTNKHTRDFFKGFGRMGLLGSLFLGAAAAGVYLLPAIGMSLLILAGSAGAAAFVGIGLAKALQYFVPRPKFKRDKDLEADFAIGDPQDFRKMEIAVENGSCIAKRVKKPENQQVQQSESEDADEEDDKEMIAKVVKEEETNAAIKRLNAVPVFALHFIEFLGKERELAETCAAAPTRKVLKKLERYRICADNDFNDALGAVTDLFNTLDQIRNGIQVDANMMGRLLVDPSRVSQLISEIFSSEAIDQQFTLFENYAENYAVVQDIIHVLLEKGDEQARAFAKELKALDQQFFIKPVQRPLKYQLAVREIGDWYKKVYPQKQSEAQVFDDVMDALGKRGKRIDKKAREGNLRVEPEPTKKPTLIRDTAPKKKKGSPILNIPKMGKKKRKDGDKKPANSQKRHSRANSL